MSFNNFILQPINNMKPSITYIQENQQGYRYPNVNNPMMNVPIQDYDNPQMYKDYYKYKNVNIPNSQSETISQAVDNDLLNKLFQDQNDFIFQRTNSQRQWYSVPVGNVPNSQTEFSEWLYGSEGNCKAGSIWNRYDIPYSNDSLLCTGFDRTGNMTNFGQLK